MSIARDTPISRGSRTVPPSISGTPQRRQNTPNTAPSSATRRSHQSASSSPPATAYPATAAITGLPRRIRVGPIGPSPSARHPVPGVRPDRLEVGAGAEHAALAVQHGDRRVGVGVERPERVGQRLGGLAVDRVAPLGPRQQHGRHRPVALDPDRRAHRAAAPIARRTNVSIDATT